MRSGKLAKKAAEDESPKAFSYEPGVEFASANEFWHANKEAFISKLYRFLAIPSISAQPQHRDDVLAAAQFVEEELKRIGMEQVEIIEGLPDEHPLIRAQWMHADSAPTVLLYAHYDVQPVDPLSLWQSPPFQPEIRQGKIFGRGSCDDKGQLFLLLKVLEGFLKTSGKLPVNVKVLFEGEEESSGKHIQRYVHEHAVELKASVAVLLDSGMFAAGMPTISTGLRGIVCAKISCRSAASDLHSGEHGGAAPNAVQGLCQILAALKTANGEIAIPGIYDEVSKPSKLESASWAKLPFAESDYLNELGASALIGSKRYSVLQRRWALPTLEVNGISGGYVGDGFKTVIPATAAAHISLRLVPDMDPERVCKLLRAYVKKVSPFYLNTELEILSSSAAILIDTANPFIQAADQAYQYSFKTETVYVREGGSIPIAAEMARHLALPVLITGFSLPDCNMHAPNENMDLANFHAGISAIGAYFDILGRMKQ